MEEVVTGVKVLDRFGDHVSAVGDVSNLVECTMFLVRCSGVEILPDHLLC